MKEYGEMQFMASSPPAADAGEYRVKVHQNVTSPVAEEIPGAEFRFFAGEKRFELEPGEIYEAYPPAGMVSDYGVTLPHIIFNKKAYPWDRRIGGGPALRENTPVKNQTPWIALLLFDEDEEPKLSEVTLQKLLNKEEKCFFPLAGTGLQPGEDWENTCSVIRMSPELFKKAVPMEAELPWLAHVRITDLHERPDNIIAHPGYFGVIVCSRFPQAVDRTVRCTAHLVSVEGFSGFLPGGREEAWKNEDWIQMVSLYHWEFSSRKSSEESFRTLTEKLDSGRLSLYQSGEPLPGGPAHAVERLQKGYTVLNHIVRTGEQTASWYRGPLTPEKPDSSLQGQNAGADGRILYDRETKLFDMKYAAAWQLGRLMMLNSKAAAGELCRWRKLVFCERRRAGEVQILKKHFEAFSVSAGKEDREHQGSIRTGFMEYLAGDLGKWLVGGGDAASVFGPVKEEENHEILDGYRQK